MNLEFGFWGGGLGGRFVLWVFVIIDRVIADFNTR